MEIWEQHDRIYHYTNHAGLQGILETQTLHATHYQYLNDTSEMLHIAPKLKEVVRPVVRSFFAELAKNPKVAEEIAKDGGLDAAATRDAETIVDKLFQVTFSTSQKAAFFDPFIASFCGHTEDYERENGLLSQWRSYGGDSGYAIVFDTKKLSTLLEEETLKHAYDSGNLGDVVYEGDSEGFKREFQRLVDAITAAVPILMKRGTQSLGELYSAFLTCVPRYKHRGFREEQEIRVVLSPMSASALKRLKEKDPVQFAKVRGKGQKIVKFKDRLVPHIVLFEGLGKALPITKIIVGPHRDKELRLQRLQRYLELRNIDAVAVASRTPLV